MSIYTALRGTNGKQFPQILKMHVPTGSVIADVTFHRGKFWNSFTIDGNQVMDGDDVLYTLLPSDLEPQYDWVTRSDLRNLPYKDDFIDCVVLDPPYAHSSTAPMKKSIAQTYNNNSVTGGSAQVMRLYEGGMSEAYRVLKKGGMLILKCQDEIESGKQRWNHIRYYQRASDMGFYAKDLFVLVQKGKPLMRWKHQKHARKNHSYWWVFELKYKKDNRLVL